MATGECQGVEMKLDAGNYKNATYTWDLNNDGNYEVDSENDGFISTEFNVAGKHVVSVKVEKQDCKTHVITDEIVIRASTKPNFKVDGLCDELRLNRIGGANDSSLWHISNGVKLKGDTVNHLFSEIDGKFEITLTSYTGTCSASLMKLYEFKKIQAEPVVSLNSNCAPAIATFKNGTANRADYRWFVDGSEVSSQEVFVMNISEAASHSIDLEIENEFGCSAKSKESIELQIDAPLISSFTLNDSTACEGEIIQLSDNSEGYIQRTIYWGDGSEGASQKSLEHQYDEPGVYQITAIIEKQSKGCADTTLLEHMVHIYEQPVANFTFSMDGLCIPQVVEVQNQSTGDYGQFNLLLNSFDTIGFDQGFVVTERGKHEIRLQLENTIAGCKDEFIAQFELHKPLSANLSPNILEANRDSSQLELSWTGFPGTNQFEVYRICNTGVPMLVTSTTDTFYNIALEKSDSQEFEYAVAAIDQCEAKSALSLTTQGIELEGAYQTDSFPTLIWGDFEAWGNKLSYYEIERNTGLGWEKVGQSFQPHFVDRGFDNNGGTLGATYRVSAINEREQLRSQSSEWAFEFQPNIYIPSAFSPNNDNLNDRYEIKGFGMEKLSVQIFNAFGQRVFDNQGEHISWDGTFKGQMVEEGTYLAVIEMTTPMGEIYEYQSSVTLIK